MREKVESISDARNIEKEIKQRLENIPQDLKKRIDERDNDAIINFIESESSNINENFKVNIHYMHSISYLNCPISRWLYFS